MPLTNAQIKAIRPGSYAKDHHDGDGLVLRVYPTGFMSWSVLYKDRGQKRRKRIGRYPTMGLQQARQERDRIKGRLAGPDAILMEAFAEEYLAGARHTKRSWAEDERIIKKDILPVLGDRPVAEVTRRECSKVLDRVRDRNAHDMARRTYAVLRRLLQVAQDRGILEINPAQRMGGILGGGHARTRVLHQTELAAWWNALVRSDTPAAPRLALTLVLATGQRLGEVLELTADDLELMDGTWIIPSAKAKNGVSHSVPLTAWALSVINEARRLHPDSAYPLPVSHDTVRTYMHKAVAAANLQRTVPHDLRRTVATHLGRLGHNRQVQDKILNHVDRSVGAIYEQHTYDTEKRAALEDWEAEFARIVSQAEDAE